MAVLTLASGCREPMSKEVFTLADKLDSDGIYHFEMDMSDTLSVYDVWLYTRIDAPNITMATCPGFGLDVTWKAPSGQMYGEEVYFDTPLGSEYYSHQYKVLYRSGLIPVEAGVWTLSLKVRDDVEGLRGMGVQTVRTKN